MGLRRSALALSDSSMSRYMSCFRYSSVGSRGAVWAIDGGGARRRFSALRSASTPAGGRACAADLSVDIGVSREAAEVSGGRGEELQRLRGRWDQAGVGAPSRVEVMALSRSASSRNEGPSSQTSCSTVPTRCTATLPSLAHSWVTFRRRSARSASAVCFASCGRRDREKRSDGP